jgi:hypothetical protein
MLRVQCYAETRPISQDTEVYYDATTHTLLFKKFNFLNTVSLETKQVHPTLDLKRLSSTFIAAKLSKDEEYLGFQVNTYQLVKAI